ncbi:hypothetical protein [Pseudobdellovibrio exovorus]|uniref:Organic solvent tolerance-like N-terminal domain-containing protein n=1 Tax=Pseudobdellovibrio exovorus JSS TaxID=1184267 RepID=M4VAL0_9BACT|nr:hypothetical protein [Pseudobdellovibrio exovorus]AGH96268.1 hypothetical protein A11Q_2052 [Pseudobdellovibrio exovorus JSS]
MKTIRPFTLVTLVGFLLTGATLSAQDIVIVDVRRNITLADDDIIYKDYYLNAGEGSALKKNMVVTVKRKINVRDSSTKSVGDFEAPVGQLKIIHLGNNVSVAREFKLISRDEEPMLEQIGIMSGDRIDTAGSFIDTSKPVYKRKTADVNPTEAQANEVIVTESQLVTPLTPTTPADKREPAAQTQGAGTPVEAPKAAVELPQI